MNEEDHNKLLAKINKLVWTYPKDLLPDDKHLLDENFDTLGRASELDKLL